MLNIELKEDSSEKLASVQGKPTKHYLFSQEFNAIVQKINEVYLAQKKKIENTRYKSTLSGENVIIPFQAAGQSHYSVTSAALVSVAGFTTAGLTTPMYEGQDVIFENQTGHDITLKNSFGVDTSFVIGADLIVPNEGKIWFRFRNNELELIDKNWFGIQEVVTPENLGEFIDGLDSKTDIKDDDKFIISDSEDLLKSKKTSFLDLKTKLKSYLDTFYLSLSVFNDFVTDVFDSLDNKQNKLTETNFGQFMDVDLATKLTPSVNDTFVGRDILTNEAVEFNYPIVEGYFNGTNFYLEAGFVNMITATTGRAYIDLSTNLQYRWSGSAYVELSFLKTTISNLRNTNIYTELIYITDNEKQGFFYYDSTDVVSSDNTGTILVSANLKRYKRIYDKYISAKWFGAIGDGITIDTFALNLWLNEKGYLYLPKGTYIVDSNLFIKNNDTTIIGDGVIKRADMVSATTTTAITTSTNPTTLVVADSSDFKIGNYVTVTTGVNNLDGCYKLHTIISKTPTSITVNNSFSKSFPSGGTIVSHHGIIQTIGTMSNIAIKDITIDGNRLNNALYRAWENNYNLYISSNNGLLENVKLINSQADGVVIGGGNSKITYCDIKDSNANGIHLSGVGGNVVIQENRIVNSNLANIGNNNNSGAGHSEGAITWSIMIDNSIITNNYIKNARTALGGIGSENNNNIVATGNFFEDCYYQAIELVTNSLLPDDGKNYIFSKNSFVNCGNLTINQNSSNIDSVINLETPFKNIIIEGNLFINTGVFLSKCKYVSVLNNVFKIDSSIIAIQIASCQYINITSNVIKGGTNGVYCQSQDFTTKVLYGKGVVINENSFFNQTSSSIFFPTSSGKMYPYLKVKGNNIINELTSDSFVAITAMSGVVLDSNNISVKTNGYGILALGDNLTTPLGIQGTICINNTVVVPASSHSIRIFGGTSAITCNYNYLSKQITNAGSSGNDTTNNYITLVNFNSL